MLSIVAISVQMRWPLQISVRLPQNCSELTLSFLDVSSGAAFANSCRTVEQQWESIVPNFLSSSCRLLYECSQQDFGICFLDGTDIERGFRGLHALDEELEDLDEEMLETKCLRIGGNCCTFHVDDIIYGPLLIFLRVLDFNDEAIFVMASTAIQALFDKVHWSKQEVITASREHSLNISLEDVGVSVACGPSEADATPLNWRNIKKCDLHWKCRSSVGGWLTMSILRMSSKCFPPQFWLSVAERGLRVQSEVLPRRLTVAPCAWEASIRLCFWDQSRTKEEETDND